LHHTRPRAHTHTHQDEDTASTLHDDQVENRTEIKHLEVEAQVLECNGLHEIRGRQVAVKRSLALPRQEIEKPDRRVVSLSAHPAIGKRALAAAQSPGPGATEEGETVFVGGLDNAPQCAAAAASTPTEASAYLHNMYNVHNFLLCNFLILFFPTG